MASTLESIFETTNHKIYDIVTRASGRKEKIPFTPENLRQWPSGDVSGQVQNVGMGWHPDALNARQYLILSTYGGMADQDGSPIALGYHTGHYEVHRLVKAAAEELRTHGYIPFAGCTLEQVPEWWENSDRRKTVKNILSEKEKTDPDDIIMSSDRARSIGLTSTATFPTGNIAPEGSVIKSTAIDPSVIDTDGVYRKTGPAKVFTEESAAIQAIKKGHIKPGDILVLICTGPIGSGMEETFQITAALRYLSWGKHVAVITDGRFSGVSTGACIGHVGPEALAGGPIGKIADGDVIEMTIDTKNLNGNVNLIGEKNTPGSDWSVEYGNELLRARPARKDLSPRPDLPDDTVLWALLQRFSGGAWGGCVYDVDRIIEKLSGNGSPDP